MLHSQITRPADPAVIVFLHGAGTSSWMWRAVTADLADYHCIAVDLPGHGGSADEPWVSFDDAAAKVEEVIADLPEHLDVYLVGASLGGYVALQMLRAAPTRFKGAIISGIHAGGQKTSGLKRAASRLMMPFMKWSFFAKRNAAAMGITDTAGFAAEAKKADRASTMTAADDVLEFTLPEDLDVIETPTLFVAGAQDQPSIVTALAAFRDANPVFKVATVDDFGPAWSTQAPALFASMVRAEVTGTELPDGILDRASIKLLEAMPAETDEAPAEEVTPETEDAKVEETVVEDETQEVVEEVAEVEETPAEVTEDTETEVDALGETAETPEAEEVIPEEIANSDSKPKAAA